jgi:hypothetical protein
VKLSEGRLSHLAQLLMHAATEGNVARPRNPRLFLNEVKRVLAAGPSGHDEKIDALVRRKIESLSRNVVPGSREWDLLYRQYSEEERRKRG